VIAWSLFDPDPVSGTLGYVRHAYSRRSAYQVLGGCFISLAPIVGGALSLGAIVHWMLPADGWSALAGQAVALASAPDRITASGLLGLVERLGTAAWAHGGPLLPLQIYLGLCVASHMAPSRADLVGAIPGALLLLAGGVATAAVAALLDRSLAGIEGLAGLLLLVVLACGLFQIVLVLAVALKGLVGAPRRTTLVDGRATPRGH